MGKDEEYEEDEGVYDDLNLDEEEEKFRMPNDESESEESEEASEGAHVPPGAAAVYTYFCRLAFTHTVEEARRRKRCK